MSPAPPDGCWVTISELARLRGVDKSAISRRVARFEEQGLLNARGGAKGTKLVLLAEFDRVAGETTDAVRALNGAATPAAVAPPTGAPGDPVLAREQARRASYDADLKRLDLEERQGELGRVADFRLSMRTCAEGVLQILEQLPGRIEEIEAALAKGGAAEGRACLRSVVREVRELLDRAMNSLIERRENAETAEASADAA